jgi:hypothetical protein
LLPTLAHADEFAAFADKEPVRARDLGVYLWATDGACSDARDQADELACREVAKTLSDRVANRTFFWRLDRDALSAGQYDKRRKSMPIVVESCLACGGIDAGGGPVVVIGRTGASSTPQPLRSTTKVFSSAAKAERWERESLPRLVGEYLFRIPRTLERVKVGDQKGVYVDVRAYRIYDRCTGEVVSAKPKSGPVKVYPGKDCKGGAR